MFLFLILINKAGIKDQNRRLGEKLTSAASKRDKLEKMHVKYVDDMTMAQSINLKDELENDQNRKWTKPAMKRDRHEQCLPLEKNQMQVDMNQLCNYANENEMRLNTGKTKTMLFNTAKNWDFLPEIHTTNHLPNRLTQQCSTTLRIWNLGFYIGCVPPSRQR